MSLMQSDQSYESYCDAVFRLAFSMEAQQELAAKFSQKLNTSDCVRVPSSEHVAEIVGRKGCKIRALRTKTKTYIKTPGRNEEPVFLITGRKEDVARAKREILSSAEHFSAIRVHRNTPFLQRESGEVAQEVRVALRLVGLVIGPKGKHIKRIQETTNTTVITPSPISMPVFYIRGLPENVQQAKREIIRLIETRTGTTYDAKEQVDQDVWGGALDPVHRAPSPQHYWTPTEQMRELEHPAVDWPEQFVLERKAVWSCEPLMLGRRAGWRPDDAERRDSQLERVRSPSEFSSAGSDPRNPGVDPDSSSVASRNVHRCQSFSFPSSAPAVDNVQPERRPCTVCLLAPVEAVLVPCGHLMFCMGCAEILCKNRLLCPICLQSVDQAVRILSDFTETRPPVT